MTQERAGIVFPEAANFKLEACYEMDTSALAKTFDGTIAVVTGASSGVGRAIALGLAEQGAVVCVVGRRENELLGAAANAKGCMDIFALDLTNEAEIETLAARVGAKYGKVNILVHSAGVFALGTTESAPVEAFDQQYSVNLRAPFVLTKALLPLLREGLGDVVFINSTAGLSAGAGVGQYAATKHGLKAIADSLRQEVNSQEIRVLSLFLGRTATAMQEQVHRLEGRPYYPERLIQPQDVAATVIYALTLPRTAEITEMSMRPFCKPV